jgi:hypothetical protein
MKWWFSFCLVSQPGFYTRFAELPADLFGSGFRIHAFGTFMIGNFAPWNTSFHHDCVYQSGNVPVALVVSRDDLQLIFPERRNS